MMRKILVIGSGGSGKSMVATRLGALLNLEVSHLDQLFWRPGWVKPVTEDWVQTVTELINRDSWIHDGNYSGTLDLRFQKCDTLVFLDLSRWLCLWRIVKRVLRYNRTGGRTWPKVVLRNSISSLSYGSGIIRAEPNRKS